VRAHRLRREHQPLGDLLAVQPLREQVEDLALARREDADPLGREPREQHRAQPLVHVARPARHGADSGQQLLGRAGLEGEAARTAVERAHERVLVPDAGVEQDAHLGRGLEDAAREVGAAAAGEADVDDRDGRLAPFDQPLPLVGIVGRADHAELRPAQKELETLSQSEMVFHDHDSHAVVLLGQGGSHTNGANAPNRPPLDELRQMGEGGCGTGQRSSRVDVWSRPDRGVPIGAVAAGMEAGADPEDPTRRRAP
jgi:hypothetical protein